MKWTFAALAILAGAGVAFAAATGADAIKERRELMKIDGEVSKPIVPMLQGKAPIRPRARAEGAEDLRERRKQESRPSSRLTARPATPTPCRPSGRTTTWPTSTHASRRWARRRRPRSSRSRTRRASRPSCRTSTRTTAAAATRNTRPNSSSRGPQAESLPRVRP